MKKLVYILLFGFVAFWACEDDDETQYYSVPGVSMVEDFIDSRDGKAYKCIEIGDQIWLAENLAYNVDEIKTNKGCRTFGESYVFLEPDSIKVTGDDCIQAALADIENGILEDEFSEMYMMPASMILNIYYGFDYSTEMLVGYMEMFGLPGIASALSTYPSTLPAKIIADSLAIIRKDAENENGHYSETYGLLYSYDAALAAVPEGWRLPTDEDWEKLERYLGMDESEIAKENTWRGTTEGALLKVGEHGIGFNALFGGGKMYAATYGVGTDYRLWTRQGQNAYFWSSEKITETDTTSLGVIRSVAVFSDQILKTTTRIQNVDEQPVLFSVRLVRDK